MKDLAPRIVSASAGTGKTYQLSSRFLELLLRGVSSSNILATTFTRKAAAEIFERVAARLAEESKQGSQEAAVRLRNFLQSQHQVRICTIDSLCTQIAKCFFEELGIGAQWTILDAHEDKALRSEALLDTVDSADAQELLELLRATAATDMSRSVHDTLLRQLGDLLEIYVSHPKEAWTWFKAPKKVKEYSCIVLAGQLASLEMPVTKEGVTDKNWTKAQQAAIVALRNENFYDFFFAGIGAAFLKAAPGEIPDFSKKLFSEPVRSFCLEIFDIARVELLQELVLRTQATAKLLELFSRHYEAKKKERSQFQFSDVKRLLAESSTLSQLDEVYFRLDTRIQHILLDEFQDTSREEWLILKPLVDEVLGEREYQRSFFCVGDSKQAIYGWRGGIAALFRHLASYYGISEDTLQKSYRTAPEILDTVNTIFSGLTENLGLSEYQEAVQRWTPSFPRHESALSNKKGYLCFSLVDLTGTESDDLLPQVVSCVQKIRELSPQAEIGVLVHTNKQVAQYGQALGAAGMRASGEGGNPLDDSAAVELLISYLRWLEHPGDEIALFHIRKSPLKEILHIPDEHFAALQFHQIQRAYVLDKGLGTAIGVLVRALAPLCNSRDQRRLQQFHELALSFREQHPARLQSFLELVTYKKVEDPASEPLRVMTIHQSKGLEFDVVILPELATALDEVSALTSKVLRVQNEKDPLGALEGLLRYPKNLIFEFDQQLKALQKSAKISEVEENLSVLYVALTRAKSALYLFAKAPKDPDVWKTTEADILRSALSGQSSAKADIFFEHGDELLALQSIEKKEKQKRREVELVVSSSIISLSRKSPRVRGRPRVSPSQLEGAQTQVHMGQYFHASGYRARERGLLLHAVLENIEWIDEGFVPADFLEKMSLTKSSSSKKAQADLLHFLESLASSNTGRLLRQNRYQKVDRIRVEREYPFLYRTKDAVLSGIMDRVVFCYNKEVLQSIELIDFKTDRFTQETELTTQIEEKILFYTPQLSAYRDVLLNNFQRLNPALTVRATLAFLSVDVVKEIL